MHCDNIQLPLWKSQQLYVPTSLLTCTWAGVHVQFH